VRERLGRLAGLRRHDEQRILDADLRPDARDRDRVGGVENVKLRVALRGSEGVAQDVRAEARAAHAEQHHVGVGARVARELAELALALGHLLGDGQPSEPVADLLALRRVAGPEGRVLGPQPARRVLLLEGAHPLVDLALQRAEAVPLARPLPRLDLLRRGLQRADEALERLDERLDAFDLELARHLVDVDAGLGQLPQLALRELHVLVDAAPDLAVLSEGRERRGWHGVDRLRTDELLDVVRVGIARVLGRGARPQAALRARAGLPQRLPARTAEELLPALVRDLGVGDRGLAVKPLEAALLRGVARRVDLLGELLVHLGVDAADEEARHARHLAEVAAALAQLLEARQVRLDDLGVAVDGEDQRDVDVVALRDLVLDRREAFLRRRDLHHDVGPPAFVVQVLGELDGASGVRRDRRADLDADKAVLALGPVVHGPEDVGCGLHVLDHEVPEHLLRLLARRHQGDQGLVIFGRAAYRLLEDRRVRRHAGHALVAQARELTGGDQLTADVVEPERLALLAELLDRGRLRLRRHVSAPPRAWSPRPRSASRRCPRRS